MSKPIRGFTALEVLVAVGLLGVLLAIGVVIMKPPSVRLLSNDLRTQIAQARYEAIERNRPVAVAWNSLDAALETRAQGSALTIGDACTAPAISRRTLVSDYGGVSIEASFETIVFLPSGQARKCDGTAISPDQTRLVLRSGKTERTLSVSSTGRVELL